jgi:hypothetical protein
MIIRAGTPRDLAYLETMLFEPFLDFEGGRVGHIVDAPSANF